MGSEREPDQAPEPEPEPEAEDVGESTLVSLYQEYIGTPETKREVYVGFGLFFAGIALGTVGLVLFLLSGTQAAGSAAFWQLREVALVAALLALPAVGTSVAVLLPVGRRGVAASLAGAVLCVAAVVWLASVYPYEWTATGNDSRVIGTYAVGLVMLAATTGSALVAQYVDRVTPRGTEGTAGTTGTPADTVAEDETVSDEQVAADIDDAMSESTLTWGGVEQEATTKRLEFDMPEEPEIDRQEIESATETRSSGGNVDDAVSGLRRLQGGDTETARAESPDDQVDALTEFRSQQSDAELETGTETDHSPLERLREKLFDR
jgi:hypothetical protein